MAKKNEDICIVTSFDEWLDRMKDLGSISLERVDAVRTGTSKEVDYLKKTFDKVAKIDWELCNLMAEKAKLEGKIRILKLRRN